MDSTFSEESSAWMATVLFSRSLGSSEMRYKSTFVSKKRVNGASRGSRHDSVGRMR